MTGPTIRGYLDAGLPRFGRVPALGRMIDQFRGQPLDRIVTDLRATLDAEPISVEDARRLHVLISRIHHDHDADLTLVRALYTEVGQALTPSTTART